MKHDDRFVGKYHHVKVNRTADCGCICSTSKYIGEKDVLVQQCLDNTQIGSFGGFYFVYV